MIGGGITGAAVARDAAARGLSVCLLEKEDWAAGTSWRSTKLVHGGLRYLETGEVGLVFESLRERAILMAAAPHLVRPAEFLFPEYSDRGRSPWQVALGLTAYDLLSLGRAPSRHRRLSRADVLRRESLLDGPTLVSGAVYPDGRTDDARLTLENVLDAVSLGATAVTRIEVVGLVRGARAIEGAVVRDVETGRSFAVRARVVVNAAGPWGDRIRSLEDSGAENILRLSRGTHLTVPFGRLPISRIVAFPLADGRLLFAVPDGAVTMLGTTDADFSGSPDEVSAEKADLEYLLAAARLTFPQAAIGEKDVVSTFAGLRPLVYEAGKSLGETSREEAIQVSEAGLLTITGGKLTTHRRMGEKAVDRARPLLSSQGVAVGASGTRHRPLPGKPPSPMAEWQMHLLGLCPNKSFVLSPTNNIEIYKKLIKGSIKWINRSILWTTILNCAKVPPFVLHSYCMLSVFQPIFTKKLHVIGYLQTMLQSCCLLHSLQRRDSCAFYQHQRWTSYEHHQDQ